MSHYSALDELLKKHFGDKQVTGIEIGTGTATATMTIMRALPNCFLYTIDPFEHREGEEFEASHSQEEHDRTKKIAIERINYYKDRCVLLAMKNIDAIKHVPKEVHFVWIDGDHSEKGITADLDLYDPLVKRGGLIGGHDYGQCHPLTEIILKRFGVLINCGDDFTWWVFK